MLVKKSLVRAREESALEEVIPLTGIKKLPELLAGAGHKKPEVLGLELDVLPAANYLFYQKLFPGIPLVDISGLVRQVRQIKSDYEIELLKNSGCRLNEVFKKIPSLIREGMRDIEIAARIEAMARAAGHMGYISVRAFGLPVFMGQLMSGSAAAVPSAFDGPTGGTGLTPAYPQGAGLKQIIRGEPVLADYVGLWDGYIIDQTRVFVIGHLSQKLAQAFETALKIQEAVTDRLKPGVNGSDLHELALNLAAEAGLADNFMGYGPDRARFLGHGTGLELDELPVLAKGLDTVLQPGMVFAVEPKFTFPGEGVVGIENTFVLTDTGAERLTITPDDLVII